MLDRYPINSLKEKFTKLITQPIRSLISSQDRLHIIKDLNLTLNKGDRLGIIGVNGSGKTSLCRCITGMYQPHSGEVNLYGEVRAIFDTAIGIQFELTGRENAYLLGKLIYPHVQNLKTIIEEALDFSELDHFLDTPFKHYSKGMQMRLCLSVISALPSDILILDEVFDGADLFFQEKIAQRVMNMIKNSSTVIFVSHSPQQIKLVCNRIIVLNENEKVFDGAVDDGIDFYTSLH